jgi:hypothetical protein
MKYNGMSKITYLISLLLLLASSALQAQALTVWPGDANNNGIANHVDLLHIGLNYGSMGPARSSVSNVWAAQTLPTAWSGGAPALPNPGYADCNGNGEVDTMDVVALMQNYGLLWAGFIPQDSGTLVASGAPTLQLFVQDSVFVSGVVTVTLDILLGDPGLQVDSIYGIAFSISFDPAIVDQILPSINGGWMNLDGRALIIQHVDTTFGRVDICIVRPDGFSVNGNGSLGSLGIVMDDNIRIASNYELPFGISFLHAIDAAGGDYYLQGGPDTLRITTITHSRPPQSPPQIQVYPVPARQLLSLRGDGVRQADLRIVDVRGVEMVRQHFKELNTHQISVADWPAGVYFLEIRNEDGCYRAKISVAPGE